jgi:acyl-CoA thioesterase-2
MGASFQIKESGVDHQITMPNLLLPEKLSTSLEQIEEIKDFDYKAYQRLKMVLPEVFEFKSIERISSQLVKNSAPFNHLWMRTKNKLVADLPLQQQLLAYVSDYNILTTATFPHREQLNKAKTFYASIDHAIWFHRGFDIQDWLLYTMDSPSASNARGFSRGSIFDRKGALVASVAQEGLMRQQIN